MLELRSVDAGYGSFQALFGINLEVRAGEAVGVIGPNGAGKTTLMRVISGLIRPRAGTIAMQLRPMPYSVAAAGLALSLLATYLIPLEWLLARGIPSRLMSSLPYLATIIVLVAISRARGVAGSAAPASLGLAFVPDR